MRAVSDIEPPSVTSRHLVWVLKDDDEDWGQIRDAVYHDRMFHPNAAAVVVVVPMGEPRRAWVDWIQVREQHGPDMNGARCVGTRELDREACIQLEWPAQVKEAAVAHVHRLVEEESANG